MKRIQLKRSKGWRMPCHADVPLDQVDLRTDRDKGQNYLDFERECEGMCGT